MRQKQQREIFRIQYYLKGASAFLCIHGFQYTQKDYFFWSNKEDRESQGTDGVPGSRVSGQRLLSRTRQVQVLPGSVAVWSVFLGAHLQAMAGYQGSAGGFRYIFSNPPNNFILLLFMEEGTWLSHISIAHIRPWHRGLGPSRFLVNVGKDWQS